MNIEKASRVSLVGAGPGDIGLISVKGLERVKKADVILYDSLVNEEILTYAPVAKKIYVGKRRGFKTMEQEEINQLLVESARSYGHVVRLKGGDSFVFGRGMEEVLYAHNLGIPTEVIPGISSAIGVPAVAGIPITHRGVSNGFWVLSATLADGSLNPEIAAAAFANSTVVILMGLNKLQAIADVYVLAGKPFVPAAVILNGSLHNERVFSGNLSELPEVYARSEVHGPGIIVIGEVVRLKSKLERIMKSTELCVRQ